MQPLQGLLYQQAGCCHRVSGAVWLWAVPLACNRTVLNAGWLHAWLHVCPGLERRQVALPGRDCSVVEHLGSTKGNLCLTQPDRTHASWLRLDTAAGTATARTWAPPRSAPPASAPASKLRGSTACSSTRTWALPASAAPSFASEALGLAVCVQHDNVSHCACKGSSCAPGLLSAPALALAFV